MREFQIHKSYALVVARASTCPLAPDIFVLAGFYSYFELHAAVLLLNGSKRDYDTRNSWDSLVREAAAVCEGVRSCALATELYPHLLAASNAITFADIDGIICELVCVARTLTVERNGLVLTLPPIISGNASKFSFVEVAACVQATRAREKEGETSSRINDAN